MLMYSLHISMHLEVSRISYLEILLNMINLQKHFLMRCSRKDFSDAGGVEIFDSYSNTKSFLWINNDGIKI